MPETTIQIKISYGENEKTIVTAKHLGNDSMMIFESGFRATKSRMAEFVSHVVEKELHQREDLKRDERTMAAYFEGEK